MTTASNKQPTMLLLDAGPTAPTPQPRPPLLDRLDEVIRAIGSDNSIEVTLVRIVNTLFELTRADAVMIDVGGLAPGRGERVVVYQGLSEDQLAGLVDEQQSVVPGMAYRVHAEVLRNDHRFGTLMLWRRSQPFDPLASSACQLAASTAAMVVHETLRNAEAEQRQRWLDAITDIAGTLVNPSVISPVLQMLADRALAVSGCDAVWLVTGSTPDELSLQAVAGTADVDLDQLRRLDLRESMVALAIAERRVIHVADLARDRRALVDNGLPRWPRIGPGVILPLLVDAEVVGGVGLAWRRERRSGYRALDPDLPARFADLAAIAISIHRSRSDSRRLAVLEERHRIRMDLHDRVLQQLYALGTSLEVARLRSSAPELGLVLNTTVERVDDAIAELRRTIAGIGVPTADIGFLDALSGAIDTALDGTTIRHELRVDGLASSRLNAAMKTEIYSTLVEAVSNVARHSSATRCRVTVTIDPENGTSVTLIVDDNGTGPPGTPGAESGLRNLRSRARRHGGDMTLTPLNPGTRLTWWVPGTG